MYRAKKKRIKYYRPRIRCPLCGFFAWASCFEKDHEIEVKMQYTRGGRAKRDFVSYRDVNDTISLKTVQNHLIWCCKRALWRLGSKAIVQTAPPTELDEAERSIIIGELADSVLRKMSRK